MYCKGALMVQHNFMDSLAVGEEHEKLLDEFFSRYFDITPATNEEQRLGIDRFFVMKGTGERYSVEYKTDIRAHDTGNAFIETVSVMRGGEVEKLGWVYTSTAQRLLYYIPGMEAVFIFDTMTLRDLVKKWKYIKAQADNGSYVGEGMLVPMDTIIKHAVGRMAVHG